MCRSCGTCLIIGVSSPPESSTASLHGVAGSFSKRVRRYRTPARGPETLVWKDLRPGWGSGHGRGLNDSPRGTADSLGRRSDEKTWANTINGGLAYGMEASTFSGD